MHYLLILFLALPAFAAVRNVKTATTSCGAASNAFGDGSHDDTTPINACIAALVPGDTLEFPAGTYLVTQLNTIKISNVTIDGSSNTATVRSVTTQQGPFFSIGQRGLGVNAVSCTGWPGIAAGSALSATANETATSFTTSASLSGVGAGSYVLLLQGGSDSSSGSGPTGCDDSGCREELVKVTGVSSRTYTVDTMLHDTWNPSVNNALACPITGMLANVTLQNISFDGGTTAAQTSGNTWGVEFNTCANCTVNGVTFKNALGSAFLHTLNYNPTFSNITITGAGSEGCGAGWQGYANSNGVISAVSTSSMNPGTGLGPCNGDGAFSLEDVGLVNSVLSNVTVDSTNAGGRPMKITASRWNTFNSLTVENGHNAAGFNGLSLEYYSAHNLFPSCSILNNAGGIGSGSAGINSFGNYNQFNTYSGCTITGNGNLQIVVSKFDALGQGNDTGNSFLGNTIGGSGTIGLLQQGKNACVLSNIFQAGMSAGISVDATFGAGTVGQSNTLNGNSSNLTAGSCSTTGANGSGALASLSASSLSFGSVAVGSTSATQTITLTNGLGSFAGTNSLNFIRSAYLLSGAQFTITANTCTSINPVSPSGTCTVTLAFAPTTSGAQSDTLVLLDNAGGSYQTVSLSGTGSGGTCGPPSYTCVTRSTAPVGTLTAPISSSSTYNTTWFSSLNPTSDCYTLLYDRNGAGAGSLNLTKLGGGNNTWSGGGNDHMGSLLNTYWGISQSGGPTAIFHLSRTTVAGALCAQNISQGGENPGISIGGAFSFSTTTDNVFYNLSVVNGTNHPVLNQNTITSDTTYTVTSNANFPFDFNNCPGIPSGIGAYTDSSILSVSESDGIFVTDLSWIGPQGTGHNVLAYKPGMGCADWDVGAGKIYAYCLGVCNGATATYTETACTSSSYASGNGLHGTQITSNGDVVQESGAAFDQLGAGNLGYWQINTANVLCVSDTGSSFDGNVHTSGHNSVGANHLWITFNPTPNIRVVDPLNPANLGAYTSLTSFAAGYPDSHGGHPLSDTQDAFPWVVNSMISTGQSYTAPPSYVEEVYGLYDTPGVPVRFGPNYNSGLASGFGCQNSIPSVSQDGQMMVFLTDVLDTIATCVPVAMVLGNETAAAAPSLSPASGTYTGPLTVTSTTTSPGAIQCWNLTGSPATNHVYNCPAGSTLLTGGIVLNASGTVYVVAGGPGYLDSSVTSATYTINQQATAPVFSPNGGTFATSVSVTMTTAIGSQIWFNTTGSPTCGSGTQYTTPVTVSSTETLYAIACGSGFTPSPVGSASFTIVSPSGYSITIGGQATVSGTAVIQ